jgi:hypothetical protein
LLNNELEKIWEEASVARLKNCPEIFLEGLKKTKKNLSEGIRNLGQSKNEARPE